MLGTRQEKQVGTFEQNKCLICRWIMEEKIKHLIKEIRDLEENKDFLQHLNKIRDKKIELISLKRKCVHDFYIVQDGFYYYDGEKEYYADIVYVDREIKPEEFQEKVIYIHICL